MTLYFKGWLNISISWLLAVIGCLQMYEFQTSENEILGDFNLITKYKKHALTESLDPYTPFTGNVFC